MTVPGMPVGAGTEQSPKTNKLNIAQDDDDCNSAITKTAIRRLLSNGIIPSINIGNKVIFNMDDLENILAEVG